VVHKADVNLSRAKATLRKDGSVQLGLSEIRSVGEERAQKIAELQPYADLQDFARRTEAPEHVIEALATAGAFTSLGVERREALWAAGALSQARPDRLPGIVIGVEAPPLPLMTPLEETVADLWATAVTTDHHLVEFVRPFLNEIGAVSAADLPKCRDRTKIVIGGVVTHRQRPATASGITFLSVEDETGLMNIVCSRQVWSMFRKVALTSPAVIIRGRLESVSNVINIVADAIEELPVAYATRSRNFQ
jgi:error-prone DNA polymerase